jgi:glycosyltransferase involved in cell wall biosynthesis
VKTYREVALISVNNTSHPRTGGEYVYSVMKNELINQHYVVHETSVPLLLERLIKSDSQQTKKENFYQMVLYFRCVFESILKRYKGRNIVLTSSHPAFPVFGHLVYHQPKTGTHQDIGEESLNVYQKLGWIMIENEKLSPVWWLAKKSHIMHLSNSFFTKRLIKNLYGLNSVVLYPPVPLSHMLNTKLRTERKLSLLVAKPEAPSGITLLPQIVEKLPKSVKLVVIGKADTTGLKVIQTLRKKRNNIDYLGYVSEKEKLKLFNTLSHYLHLGFNESFGITIIEAMATGCIPIAPKSGAIPEYLPQELLYLSPTEAAEKIIAKVGVDDDFKMRLRNIATEFHEEKFRSKFMAYMSALENMMN